MDTPVINLSTSEAHILSWLDILDRLSSLKLMWLEWKWLTAALSGPPCNWAPWLRCTTTWLQVVGRILLDMHESQQIESPSRLHCHLPARLICTPTQLAGDRSAIFINLLPSLIFVIRNVNFFLSLLEERSAMTSFNMSSISKLNPTCFWFDL